MSEVLYKSTINNSYILVTNKGLSYSIYRPFGSFSGKFIDNELLRNTYIEMEINVDNIQNIFKDLNVRDMDKIDLRSFKDFNFLYYKERPYKISNWSDCSDFVSAII